MTSTTTSYPSDPKSFFIYDHLDNKPFRYLSVRDCQFIVQKFTGIKATLFADWNVVFYLDTFLDRVDSFARLHRHLDVFDGGRESDLNQHVFARGLLWNVFFGPIRSPAPVARTLVGGDQVRR